MTMLAVIGIGLIILPLIPLIGILAVSKQSKKVTALEVLFLTSILASAFFSIFMADLLSLLNINEQFSVSPGIENLILLFFSGVLLPLAYYTILIICYFLVYKVVFNKG